jgi:transposase
VLRARPWWRDNDARLPRAPGRGPGCARTVRWARPAWGTRPRQQRAAVGGVAPRNGASGPLRGRRLIGGGRAQVRPVWDMGPLVATRDHPRRKALSQRLLAVGKGKKVALTAWMHTFLPIRNARLKPRTPWQAQEVQN